MPRLDSLARGVGIWTALEAQYKAEMVQFKKDHKVSWWFRPSYWRIESKHHKVFIELINYRIKYVTALKESQQS